MVCPNCGNKNDADAKFCDECGAPLTTAKRAENTVKVIRMRCRNCDGIMKADESGKVMVCPYCGSKELILESEKITLAKIRAQQEAAREEKQKEEEVARSFEKSWFRRLLIILAFLDTIFAMTAFIGSSPISGYIAVAQAVLNLGAWLIGMRIIKVRQRNLPRALFVAGWMLLIPYVFFFNGAATGSHRSTSYKWEDSPLTDLVEKPSEDNIFVGVCSEDLFSADVSAFTATQYRAYIESCTDKGFNIDIDTTRSGYTAFDENGTKLELYFYESMGEMSVRLTAPVRIAEMLWPSSGLADLLPVPDSETGQLVRENSWSLEVYVGDTPLKDYAAYVQKCIDKGFDVKFSREQRYYRAENKEGDSLRVEYYGNNIMAIELYRKDED